MSDKPEISETIKTLMQQELGPELLAVMMENAALKAVITELLSVIKDSENFDTCITIEEALDEPRLVYRWRVVKQRAIKLLSQS